MSSDEQSETHSPRDRDHSQSPQQTQTSTTSTSTTSTSTTQSTFEVVVDDTSPQNGETDINFHGSLETVKISTEQEKTFDVIKKGLESLESNLQKTKGMGTLDDMQELVCSMRKLQEELKSRQDLTSQLTDIKGIKTVLLGYRSFFVSIKEEFSDVWTLDIDELLKEFASTILEIIQVSDELVNFRQIFYCVLIIKQSESIVKFSEYVSRTTVDIKKLVDVMAHFAGEDTESDMSEYDLSVVNKAKNKDTKDTIEAFYQMAKDSMTDSTFSRQTKIISDEIKVLKTEKVRFEDILSKLKNKVNNMTCGVDNGGDIDATGTQGTTQ